MEYILEQVADRSPTSCSEVAERSPISRRPIADQSPTSFSDSHAPILTNIYIKRDFYLDVYTILNRI